MKNAIVYASYLAWRYWEHEHVYFTYNGDGTWHITHWGSNEPEIDVSSAEARKVYDKLADNVRNSKLDKWAKFEVVEITESNVDEITKNLMQGYDHYACMIDSYRQQTEAEENNRAICRLVGRIEKAIKVAKAA